MIARQPSWETLNAYVDSELSAGEAAAVARALADDRALADTVAALTRLKAAVQDGVEPVELSLPRPGRRAWSRIALAASLAAVLAIGAAVLLGPWQSPSQPAWLAQAWAVHGAWTAAGKPPPDSKVDSGVVLVALNRVGSRAYLPDLSSARLTLSRIAPVTLPGRDGEALHIGYRGTRGCQVSLLVVPGGAWLPEGLTRYDNGTARTYAWRTGTHGYLIMAEGMDEARLALIARSVRRASLEHSPLDDETRTALRDSRKRSTPCLG